MSLIVLSHEYELDLNLSNPNYNLTIHFVTLYTQHTYKQGFEKNYEKQNIDQSSLKAASILPTGKK